MSSSPTDAARALEYFQVFGPMFAYGVEYLFRKHRLSRAKRNLVDYTANLGEENVYINDEGIHMISLRVKDLELLMERAGVASTELTITNTITPVALFVFALGILTKRAPFWLIGSICLLLGAFLFESFRRRTCLEDIDELLHHSPHQSSRRSPWGRFKDFMGREKYSLLVVFLLVLLGALAIYVSG